MSIAMCGTSSKIANIDNCRFFNQSERDCRLISSSPWPASSPFIILCFSILSVFSSHFYHIIWIFPIACTFSHIHIP